MNTAVSNRTFFKTFLAIGAIVSLSALYQTEVQTEAFLKIRTRYKWALLMILFAVNAALALAIVLRNDGEGKFWDRLSWADLDAARYRIAGVVLTVAPLPILWLVRAQFFGRGLEAFFRLLWLFWWCALVQAAGLRLAARVSWPRALAGVLVFDGGLAELYTLVLPVSNYPFSMGWSEASRFYYGSLVFSKTIYGARVPLSVWHGSRYLMLAIPFLIKGLPIWAARLWQVLLWLGVTATSSWALVRRVRVSDRMLAVILGIWFFLYLFQGAVYYHLQVCVIIILLGVAAAHPWRSLAAVLVASFWAGMSRLNWYPVPAMLAIALYLLEERLPSSDRVSRYVRTPVLWGISGMVAALSGQAFYIAVSGNTNLEAFGSSLTSALLWYRWLPSATNPIGIIPGVLLISLPGWLLVLWLSRQPGGHLHPLRWYGLMALLAVLLVGGLVVSTKIGGGGDLHNMDAYMVLLGMIAAYILTARVVPEADAKRSSGRSTMACGGASAACSGRILHTGHRLRILIRQGKSRGRFDCGGK